MTAPLVSVLVPCYNAEAYVAAALESVLAQTYAPIEVIVVDDGSTDGSAAVLEGFRARGVTVIRQDNRGQCAAANRALAEASGRYIKFFDADDWLDSEMVARQLAAMNGRDGRIVFGEWARFFGQPEGAKFAPLPAYRNARPVDWLASEWASGQPMMQCAMFLIPRAILDRTGGWDERLSLINDFEFFARVLTAAEEMVFAQGARLHYRSGVAGSLSGQVTRKAAESACLSLLVGTGHLLAADDSPRTRTACAAILQGFEYEHYPTHADLRRRVRKRVAELGGARGDPSGPPAFHALRRWIGWKAARRVQHLAERFGLNRAGRARAAHG